MLTTSIVNDIVGNVVIRAKWQIEDTDRDPVHYLMWFLPAYLWSFFPVAIMAQERNRAFPYTTLPSLLNDLSEFLLTPIILQS